MTQDDPRETQDDPLTKKRKYDIHFNTQKKSVLSEVLPLVDDHETVCKDNFGGQLLRALSSFAEVLLRSWSLQEQKMSS